MDVAAIRIKTKIETKDANSQLLTLQNSIVKLAEKTDRTLDELEELGKLKIPTDEYKELEKDLGTANKAAEKLHQKLLKLSEKGTYNDKYQSAEAEYMEMREYANEVERKMQALEESGTAFIDPTTTDAYKKKAQELEACNREMEILNKKHEELAEKQDEVNGGSGKLLKRITGLASRVFIFSQITKAFNTMLSAMKEGLQDMSQYSDEYNANMSQFSSRTTELKYNLAAMAEPVLNLLIPAFTTLTGWINTAVEAVTKFLSALSGKNTYTKAKKQVIDYAKGVAKAGEETKGALADFDDLNVLNQNTDSGTSANGALSGADAFEEVEIESEFIEKVNKIKEICEQLLPFVIAIGVAFAGWKLISFVDSLMETLPLLEKVAPWLILLAGMALMVFEYLDMWNEGVSWEGLIGWITGVCLVVAALLVLFGPVAAGIALIVIGISGVILALKDMCENGVSTENMTLLLISALGILIGVFMVFGGTATLIVGIVMAVIGILAALVAYSGNGEEALGHLKDAFGELGEFVKCIFTQDMEGMMEHLKNAGKSFANFFFSVFEGIANGFIKMVNAAIDAINSLNFDIPEWLQGITGMETFGLNLRHWDATVTIPRLANGGITTGSTIANIGEAGREAVLPLENNLDYLDAFADKIAGKMGNAAGAVDLTVNLDGKTVYKRMVQLDREFAGRIGRSQFAY